MKLDRTTRNVLYGYGAFCAVNWALTYYAARSGSPLLFGSAGLLSLNETLRKVNALAYLIDPIAVAEKHGSGSGQTSTGSVVCVTAGGVTACTPPDQTP